jgi:hypothetical protein
VHAVALVERESVVTESPWLGSADLKTGEQMLCDCMVAMYAAPGTAYAPQTTAPAAAHLLVAFLELLQQVWGVSNCHHQRLLVHLQNTARSTRAA